MSTTLATVASSSLSVVSSQTQVASSQLNIYCDIELLVGTTAGPFGAGSGFTVFTVPTIDGTNSAELNQAELEPLCFMPMTTSTSNTQHRVTRRLIPVSPIDFACAVYNGTTQTLSTGSGANTLKLAFYDINLNA